MRESTEVYLHVYLLKGNFEVQKSYVYNVQVCRYALRKMLHSYAFGQFLTFLFETFCIVLDSFSI
jgi:hypothetical protein